MWKVLLVLVLVLVVLDCHAADDDAPPDVPELHTAVGMFEFNCKTMPMHSNGGYTDTFFAVLLLFEWNCTCATGDGDNAKVLKLLQDGADATVRNECVIFVMYYLLHSMWRGSSNCGTGRAARGRRRHVHVDAGVEPRVPFRPLFHLGQVPVPSP